MPYQAHYESLKQHPVPQWFHDAKLGIFVHWGLYSVPAWATHEADIDKVVATKGWEHWFANNAYAEWYLNTLRIAGSPTHSHHLNTYGADFSYDDFAPMFERAAEEWNPDDWAALFQQVGARYVVLTTKHHDGFLLWPSARSSPHKPGRYATQRDLVGELSAAVRQHQMRMGLYYSGGLDWSFHETPVRTIADVRGTIVQSQEFVEYADFHWRELIERYAPSILWNDIGYPAAAKLPQLFADYYNKVAEGLVNDRWRQQNDPGAVSHGDFTTPEYARYDDIVEKKWEATRGIGHSFGYNQLEGPDDCLSVEELVHSFVDIVSKNANLLLDVGPMADGTIPELQRERLLGLGQWLSINGEAIFETRPWQVAKGSSSEDNIPLRFTQKDATLYAVLLGRPPQREIRLDKLKACEGTQVSLLGSDDYLSWTTQGDHMRVSLPELNDSPAYTLKIVPAPSLLR